MSYLPCSGIVAPQRGQILGRRQRQLVGADLPGHRRNGHRRNPEGERAN